MSIKLLFAFAILAVCVCPVLSMPQFVRTGFPGGNVLLLPNQQFVWEASDVSNLFPSQVSEVELQTVVGVSGQTDAKLLLTLYTKDNRYYLVVLGDGAAKGLGSALTHAGLVEP